MSPSLGREWIEIHLSSFYEMKIKCLPPWGGSGLKFLPNDIRAELNNVPLLGEGVD